ncbi:unnamed protein product, partial [Didymodactylos carnosus]
MADGSVTLARDCGATSALYPYKTKYDKNDKTSVLPKRGTTASQKVDISSDEDNVATQFGSSLVWQYATRCIDRNYAICNLCSNDKRISTNHGSTSTLRQHLISKHGKNELMIPIDKKKDKSLPFSLEKKRQLDDYLIKSVASDARTFNDFGKSGIKKFLEAALP